MRRPLRAAACVAALAGGVAGQARAAAYTFSAIAVPGVNDAQALGINNAGQVIIEGGDVASVLSQGFLDTGGNVAPVTLPNGGSVFLTAINNNGQLTGTVGLDAFIDTNGAFVSLPRPGPAQLGLPAGLGFPNGFFATGINSSDVVTGFNVLVSGTVQNTIETPENFTYSNGAFTLLPAQPAGINDAGQIVESGGILGANGVFTPIKVPGPGNLTQTTAISSSGLIAGTYVDSTGNHGFVDDKGVFTVLDVPSAFNVANSSYGTNVTGINDAGDVVGYYTDASFQRHAFLATPAGVTVPEPASAALLGTGLAGLALALRQRHRVG